MVRCIRDFVRQGEHRVAGQDPGHTLKRTPQDLAGVIDHLLTDVLVMAGPAYHCASACHRKNTKLTNREIHFAFYGAHFANHSP